MSSKRRHSSRGQEIAQSSGSTSTSTSTAGPISEAPSSNSEAAAQLPTLEEAPSQLLSEEGEGQTTAGPPPTDASAAPAEPPPADVALEAPVTEAPATEAPATEAPATEAPATDIAALRAEFRQVYRTTSAAETDVWLSDLAARGASDPPVAALATELRTWVDEQRAAKAALAAEKQKALDDAAAAAEAAPAAGPAETTHEAPIVDAEAGGATGATTGATTGETQAAPEGGLLAAPVEAWYGTGLKAGEGDDIEGRGKAVEGKLASDPAWLGRYNAAVAALSDEIDIWDVVVAEMFAAAMTEKNAWLRLSRLRQTAEAEGVTAAQAEFDALMAEIAPASVEEGSDPEEGAAAPGGLTEAPAADVHYVFKPRKDKNKNIIPTNKLSGATIGKEAVVLDPSDLSKLLPPPAALPAGLALDAKKRLVVPAGTAVEFRQFDSACKRVLIGVGGAEWWVNGSSVKLQTISLADRFEVQIKEERGEGAGKILIFEHGGEDLFAPPGGIDEFDLRFATPLEGEAPGSDVLLPSKDAASGSKMFADGAAESHMSTGEIDTTGKVVYRATGVEYDAEGVATGAKANGPCATLSVKAVGKMKLVEILLFDGRKTWVASSNVKAWGEAAQFSIEERDGGLFLVTSRDANDPDQKPAELPIAPAVAAELQAQVTKNAEALIGEQEWTENQKILLTMCDEYLANPSLGSAFRSLAIPADKTKEGGESLSGDLIQRLQRYYRFLQYAGLILGPVEEIGSGIRSRPTAHKLSTLWTINTKSGHLTAQDNKVKFARMLVEIDGNDATCGISWCDATEVQALTSGLAKVDGGEEMAAGVLEIDAVIAAMRASKRYGTDQTAPAAEGYPKGDANRSPSLWTSGVSNHCGGEAIDITFPFVVNYFDPILDALSLKFGLVRAVKEGKNAEHWHYERVGVNSGPEE